MKHRAFTVVLRPVQKHGSSSYKLASLITSKQFHTEQKPPQPDELDLEGLKNRMFVYEDVLFPGPLKLLNAALGKYLPNESHASRADSFILGQQYAFFRPDISADMLCHDGTDTKFLPGPESIWKYRLWAGGSVHLREQYTKPIHVPYQANLIEQAGNVRVVTKEGRAEKVFVDIERKFTSSLKLMAEPEQIDHDVKEEEPLNEELPFMTEIQKLCFLREPPASIRVGRTIKPPSSPIFKHTMTPSSHLLFQFSALTHNAHRIHIDPEFARFDYGAKNMLVHGPLTQVLMVEFLQRYLRSSLQESKARVLPISIDYTNLQPLFAYEPLTFCCKPVSKGYDEKIGKETSWQVWIQKEEKESFSCAVKATIEVRYIFETHSTEPEK